LKERIFSRRGHGSGVILHFFRTRVWSQNFVKNRTRIHFLFLAVAGVCVVFVNVTAKVQVHFCILVASMLSGVWTAVEFSN